ncbi:MAG: M13 family metallopeptidase [Ignavibacteria bacterium]|jgi:putative endopeptidase
MKKTSIITLSALLSISLVFIASCSTSHKGDFKAFDVSANIDSTVSPADNFFQYAVGTWIKNNPIPADKPYWSAFNELRDNTREQVKEVVLDASANKNAGKESVGYKVGLLYNLGLDTTKINKENYSPIIPELERINSISGKEELTKEIAHMQMYTASPLFFFYSPVDAKNSDSVIAGIWQGGLGLPDRDYYFNEDDRSKDIREKYLGHVANMFKLIGNDNELSGIQAKTIMDFETKLAGTQNTRVENRNPEEVYNKYSTDELYEKAPGFDWKLYFFSLEAGDPGHVNVAQPKYLAQIGKMVKSEKLEDWKTYLTWNLIRSMADYLSSDFVDERFEFEGKFLDGQEKNEERYKRVLTTVSGALGEAVGQLYVAKFFPPEAKEKALNIVKTLKVSMGESIKNNDWMSEETKQAALKKLDALGLKIGYPDKWTDYSSLEIKDDSYAANIMRANYFAHKQTLSKINQPVRDWEWGMTPQTVNAYYSPTRNEIVFPAGILQYPFYDYRADDAINYGAMGVVIGHEITHGFDDSGRKYDLEGNISDWWTKDDAAKFEERADMLIQQFNEYVAIDSLDLHVNGKLTLGENIADLGGCTVSFNAFKNTEQFKKRETIDGFTPAQRFFLGYTQIWKGTYKDGFLERLVKTDPHSPGKFRVIGVVSNLPPFFEAFDIPEGAPMRRDADKIVKIW